MASLLASTYRCRDCGHRLPIECRTGQRSMAEVEVVVDVTGLVERMQRHVDLNPDRHPSFIGGVNGDGDE